MDYKIFNFNLDLGRESRNAIKPVQGESAVKLRPTLTHNSQPFNLTDCDVRCLFRKPDMTYSYIDGVIIDAAKGIVEIALTNQVLLLSGSVVGLIEVTGAIGIARTWLFTMDVQPGMPLTDVISMDEFPAVEQMLIDVADIKANFNAVVAGVTVDGEVILARGVFTTLQERLDAKEAEFSAQLGEIDGRIDNIVVTPAVGVSEQEILDARQGKVSLGANITDVKSQLADSATNILASGGFTDGITDNLAVYNTAKIKLGKVMFFPQNATNNAIYYFSTKPDFTGIIVKADEGVMLSLPDTNHYSLKDIKLISTLVIRARDRSNSVTLQPNIVPEWMLVNGADKDCGLFNPTAIDMTTLVNARYLASNGVTSVQTNATKAVDKFSFLANAMFAADSTIQVAELVPVVGKEYLASVYNELIIADGNSAGIVVNFGTEWIYVSVGRLERWSIGKWNGVWSENWFKLKPFNSKAYAVSSGSSLVLSARIISTKKVAFYVNGAYLTTYISTTDITKLGFGANGTANTGLITVDNIVSFDVIKKNHGKKLNIAVFGDSISASEGVNLPWPEILKFMLKGKKGIPDISIDNFAVSGNYSANQWALMSPKDLTVYDFVLVLVGTNDIQTQQGVSTLKTNVGLMIDKIKTAKSNPVVGIPFMWESKTETATGFETMGYNLGGTYRTALYRLCAEKGVMIADVVSDVGSVGIVNNQVRDNLHPTIAANSFIAMSFTKSVIKILDDM